MAKDSKKNDITKKTLKHYIDLEFYANGVDADLQALLDEVTTDCEEVIESQESYSTKDGYSVAYRAIKEKIESFGDALEERLEKEAGAVKENEEKFLKGLYGAALAVAAVPLSKVLFAPADGRDTVKTFAERAKKNLLRTYDTALRSGYIFAKPSKDISSQAKAALPQIKRGIQAGIQTAIPAAAKTTDSIIFAANALEVVWCTTLDGNVCLECASLSGQHFKSMSDAPSLPRHNRCRCVLLPAAMVSEPLPSYQEFIESLSEDEQRQVLGKNRYELYKSGQVSLKQFLNNGKVLRIDELKKSVENPSLKNSKKLYTATKEELKQFLENSIKTNENKRISLGVVSEKARTSIKNKTGFEVNRIILDSGEIRHAMKKKEHHIELSDLEKITEIVETPASISLEPTKHQNNSVVRFIESKKNGINILMEFRSGKGDLSLVTAYRVKKQ